MIGIALGRHYPLGDKFLNLAIVSMMALGLGALPLFATPAAVRTVLFNGKDLKGWHTQGKGTWQVVDSTIQGRNPPMDWAHLVTDSSYGDSFMRIKFKNIAGNSGLYFRTDTGGAFGVHGIQIEIHPSADGSAMWVTTTAYGWVEMTTKVQRDSLVKPQTWTDLAVWTKGKNFTIYLNNKKILQRTNVTQMALTGKFALQMHSGDNNEIYFKNLEVSVPTLEKNCQDALYLEYQKDLPLTDPGVCGAVVSLVDRKQSEGYVPSRVPVPEYRQFEGRYWDLAGKTISEKHAEKHAVFGNGFIFPK